MQRFYNWLVILFLCILTVNFCRARNNLSEVVHNRYKNNVVLSEVSRNRSMEIGNLRYALDAIKLAYDYKLSTYSYLQDISVRVLSDAELGTGVLFTREIEGEQKVFIWTAGHVVASLQRDDGSFKNATIKMEVRVYREYVNENEMQAKVVAYSSPYTGEDLALLEITEDCMWFKSAIFAGGEIQPVGTEIIHVGSTVGLEDSVSLGIVSQTDRELGGKMYDQTSTMAYPGSSGGGVYTTDGQCIGLVTLAVGPGLNFYVPMRRIRAWAKKEGIEWAIDKSVPVPLSRTPTELEMIPREAEIIISLPPSPVSLIPSS